MATIFDDVTDVIGETFNLTDKQEKLVRAAIIVAAVYFGARFVKSLIRS